PRIPTGRMRPHMRSHEIRSRFVDHFAATGHQQLPSGSLVPPDWDQSVLITTAGMQPLKQYFLGLDQPPSNRLVTVQKCFRTVDIDEVGRTAHHLTFFEMLGNFSIGDYFKDFAVEQAWTLVTSPQGFGFHPDRLWATVYRGDEKVPADEEAIDLWLGVGVPASGSCGWGATTSGRPDRSAPAAPAPSCTTTAAPSSAADGPRAAPTANATASSSSGTSCSCSTTCSTTDPSSRCRPRASTPAPGSSAARCSPRASRAPT